MRALVAALAVALGLAGAAEAQVVAAEFAAPTDRYAHGVLGDALEWGELHLTVADGRTVRIVLPETAVFEDTAPRLADIDGDGADEAVVVEASLTQGARLAVYGPAGRIAATPYIGRPYRWLAPVGAADLDGDGRVEIAYVDRPHLARILRVWRHDGRDLRQIASAPGFSNHRIGERDIAGGIRDCGEGPEMIVADAAWQRVMAVRFDGTLAARAIGPHRDRASFAAAMACR